MAAVELSHNLMSVGVDSSQARVQPFEGYPDHHEMPEGTVPTAGRLMAIQWGAVAKVAAAVATALGFAKFGSDVSQRVDSLQKSFVDSRDLFVRQLDKTTEALPWERQLRMLDALTTDCGAVTQPLAKQDCIDARRKLEGQVETMRKALGASQSVPGEWQVRMTVEDTLGRPFTLPTLGLIDVLLPNLAIDQASTNARVVEAEVGRRHFLVETGQGAIEARRPVTNREADSIVRDAARKAVMALDLQAREYSVPDYVRADPEWQRCIEEHAKRGRGSDGLGRGHLELCTREQRERDFVNEFARAVNAFRTTVAATTTAKGLGSVYVVTRPYEPYSPKPHTIFAMSLEEFEKLGSLGDSLIIRLRVHKRGLPDSLFPGSTEQTFYARDMVRSRNMRWRQDRVGLAWGGGHGLVLRDGRPLTGKDIEVAQADADSLAKILQTYGQSRGSKP